MTDLVREALNEALGITVGLGNGGTTRSRPIEEWQRLYRLMSAARDTLPPRRRCGCTADTELAAGPTCTACGHRDHGRSGCLAWMETKEAMNAPGTERVVLPVPELREAERADQDLLQQVPQAPVKTESAGRLAETVDAALHEWWDDQKPDGSTHACRPVPDESTFLAIADRMGIAVYLKNADQRFLKDAIAEVLHRAHGGGPWDDDVTGGCGCDDRAKRLLAAEETNAEMQALFDMQWTRMQQAIKHWQKAHPGKELTWPDLGALLTWLLEDRKRLLEIAVAARTVGSAVAARDRAAEREREASRG